MPSIHDLIRLARKIHAAYQQTASRLALEQQADWSHLQHRFELAQQQRELVEKARSHGWHLAAHQQQDQLRALLRSLAESLRDAQEKMLLPPQPIPCLKDLLAELQSVEREFDDVVYQKSFLAVQTEAIVLKGIDLGRFSIRFFWSRLKQKASLDCFEVVALEANSARGNEDITHPHVRSRSLCAGDATLPLQKALEDGRLTDAFHLIQIVLQNYNADSAYASLDDWESVSCWNCGYTTNEDDRSFCEGCDQDVCSDCTSTCKHCDRYRCTSCQVRCDVCNEPCCSGCQETSDHSELSCCKDCLRTCTACDAEVASSEFDEDSELCPVCCEAQDSAEADAANNDEPIPVPTP